MIRPEILESLKRWRDALVAVAALALGVWLSQRGGLFFLFLGGLVALIALALLYLALRRMRLTSTGEAPGYVEVLEGRIAYYAPRGGGYADLDAVVEVGILSANGLQWRFVDAAGDALLIPVDASGADTLPDVLSALPGFSLQAVIAATADPIAREVVWRRTPQMTQSG